MTSCNFPTNQRCFHFPGVISKSLIKITWARSIRKNLRAVTESRKHQFDFRRPEADVLVPVIVVVVVNVVAVIDAAGIGDIKLLFFVAEKYDRTFVTQVFFRLLFYTITINHRLSIYTSMIHSLLSLKLLELTLNSLYTLSDVRIKAFTLLF
jgi:hypothetical protein